MPINKVTKSAISSALEELLLTYSFTKVTVKDISDTCGISRNTFYYHFSDKYELMDWIFTEDLAKNVKNYDDPDRLADTFLSICSFMLNRRNIYYPFLQYTGQNSLQERLTEFYYELWLLKINIQYANSGLKLRDSELNVYARMNAHALVGLMCDWVNNGMRNDYTQYLDEVYSIVYLQSELHSAMLECRLNMKENTPQTNNANGAEVS